MTRHGCIWFLVICSSLWACRSSKPFYNKKEKDWDTKKMSDSKAVYTIYLLGELDQQVDTGILNLLKNDVGQNDTSHLIAFLGDDLPTNVSDDLLTKQQGKDFSSMNEWFNFLKKDKGRTLFIPGDGDEKEKPDSQTKDAIEKRIGKKNMFLPSHCSDFFEILLTDDLLLLPINTSWWLKEHDSRKSKCDIKNESEWVDELKDLVDNNQRKNILILGHHPLMSAGNNGGHFSFRQHLFPLTDLNRNLYIPLPIIGSLYPLMRAGIGSANDFAFPSYKKLRENLFSATYGYNNVIYAGAHEHNIQYFKQSKQDFIVTNSSRNRTWVGKSNKAHFTYSAAGIVKLSFLKNGEVWMEVLATGENGNQNPVVYRKRLKDNVYGKPDDSTSVSSSKEIANRSIVVAADSTLEAGRFKQIFLGEHYRNAWTTPVEISMIDLRKEQGGFEIEKKGGGFQTKSLRLKNKKGEEYTLRSINKYPEKLLGPHMKNTLAADVVRDQVSSSHPYAPGVVADLAETAGILHSEPKIVFVPNDLLLEEYRKDFANKLALLEQRADGKISDRKNFGYAEESVSSDEMFDRLHKDHDEMIDDKLLLKSRLFDMWINDWDRHDGNWRWGVIRCDGENEKHCSELKATSRYYIPIPNDRDQAFSRFDGLLPWLAGRKWAVRKFQDFKNDIRDVPGLNFNARNFDHALLTELSASDWDRSAKDLQSKLTDEKIEHALRQFPDTIYKLDASTIVGKLKARREKLPDFARTYYKYLAQYVDVLGSDKQEKFVAERLSNDSTRIKVFALANQQKERLIYERTFSNKETREVRLYGLDGDDIFLVSGDVKRSLLLRIVGGDGEDSIVDASHVRGWTKKTKVYDDKKKNHVKVGKEAADLTSDSKTINEYDYNANDYNVLGPAIFFGYNIDDGIFLGGGIMSRYHRFRKQPYANFQRIVANASVYNGSFNFKYTGDFNSVIGKWGINIDFLIIAPKGTTNFFGLGNETKRLPLDNSYYRLRYDNILAFPSLKRHLGRHHEMKIGPVYEYVRIVKSKDKYITSPEAAPYLISATPKSLWGGKIEYQFVHVDDSILTFRGIKWISSLTSQAGINSSPSFTSNLESQLCIFIPVGNRSTLALRGGGAHRFGDFEFYQANALGGMTLTRDNGNLRGYLRGRYMGRSAAYFNTDLRVKLFSFRTYLFPAHLGLLGFYDQGRVWSDGESSNQWHQGYGGGIWFDPFAKAVVNLTYAISDEEQLFSVGIGFLF